MSTQLALRVRALLFGGRVVTFTRKNGIRVSFVAFN